MKILILETYYTGSHKVWADNYKERSGHDVRILGLEGRYWKWRMHGGGVTLGRLFLGGDFVPDLILATDMVDITTFLALTREVTSHIPVATYFHENQYSYPWSPIDRDVAKGRDSHYHFINYSTALASDGVFFNSAYHMTAFFAGLERFLKGMPDLREIPSIERIRERSSVLPLGVDFTHLDRLLERGGPSGSNPLVSGGGYGGGYGGKTRRRIIWNHRWEHDKNPEEFFGALFKLMDEGLDFEVAVLGESFGKVPEIFEEARERLGERITHFGHLDSKEDYYAVLTSGGILPVTSLHDFFGISVVEGIYGGLTPLLPNRLAYPEHIPGKFHSKYLYSNFNDLIDCLRALLFSSEVASSEGYVADERGPEEEGIGEALKDHVARYSWSLMSSKYDSAMEALLEEKRKK